MLIDSHIQRLGTWLRNENKCSNQLLKRLLKNIAGKETIDVNGRFELAVTN